VNGKKIFGIILLILLFASGLAGGYLYFSKVIPGENNRTEQGPGAITGAEDLFGVRIYYPIGTQLQIEERRIPRRVGQMAVAETIIEQYLQGPADKTQTIVPQNSKILGLYRGADRILYVDLSGEFRRNFQGDVFAEFLLLKGLYESLISNVEDIQDVKVLIEGKESETLGGHFYLLYPLRETVSYGYE
jgi:hypothetical protein